MRPPPPHEFLVADAVGDQPLDALASFTLPAGGTHICSPNATIVNWASLRAKAIAGKERLYATGLIAYTDVFGDDQWAEFNVYLETAAAIAAIEAASKTLKDPLAAGFMVAGFGNDASFNPRHTKVMDKWRSEQKAAS